MEWELLTPSPFLAFCIQGTSFPQQGCQQGVGHIPSPPQQTVCRVTGRTGSNLQGHGQHSMSTGACGFQWPFWRLVLNAGVCPCPCLLASLCRGGSSLRRSHPWPKASPGGRGRAGILTWVWQTLLEYFLSHGWAQSPRLRNGLRFPDPGPGPWAEIRELEVHVFLLCPSAGAGQLFFLLGLRKGNGKMASGFFSVQPCG